MYLWDINPGSKTSIVAKDKIHNFLFESLFFNIYQTFFVIFILLCLNSKADGEDQRFQKIPNTLFGPCAGMMSHKKSFYTMAMRMFDAQSTSEVNF